MTIVYATSSLILTLAVLTCVLPYLWRRHQQRRQGQSCSSSPGHQVSASRWHDASSLAPEAAAAAARPLLTPANHSKTPNTDALQKCLTKHVVNISQAVARSAWMKLALSALMTLVWLAAHLNASQRTVEQLEARGFFRAPSGALQAPNFQGQSQLESSRRRGLDVFSADLLNYFAVTCALAITAITRISFLVKTIIILAVLGQQVLLNMSLLGPLLSLRSSMLLPRGSKSLLDQQQQQLEADLAISARTSVSLLSGYDQWVFTLTLVLICWALYLMNRQFELTNRRLFLWRKQVEERKEKVADMRRKNEALVYNILPPNVAKIFLGKRQLNDEELYSKSYEAVGVLFAAMPNFSDFYTEESVNNQGLECLRFLNEVISDYDALLDQARFKNIIKIKTMGSTYMAASGLYEGDAQAERQAGGGDSAPEGASSGQQVDEVRAKWGHLEQLTEFALALKETLNNINKESFNNFVLRIGELPPPNFRPPLPQERL